VTKVYEEIRRLGGDVLVIGFGTPADLAGFLEGQPLPFPAAVDPGRRAYEAFGLGRTSWPRLVGPVSLFGYARLMIRGWLPWKAQTAPDVLQLGGDFVLDGRRRIAFAYRSVRPTDRPTAQQLLQAVRDAAGP
jgi:peroxiredoxin